jgi:hypothetical protein
MEGTPRAAINFEQQYVTCASRFYQNTGILGLICVNWEEKASIDIYGKCRLTSITAKLWITSLNSHFTPKESGTKCGG